MWSRWSAGYHVREIARAFGRDHGSIRNLLLQQGGIAPRLRTRAIVALTLAEREDISRGIAAGESGHLACAGLIYHTQYLHGIQQRLNDRRTSELECLEKRRSVFS
jgi:hypothetical protein